MDEVLQFTASLVDNTDEFTTSLLDDAAFDANIDDVQVVTIHYSEELPIATEDTLGCIKVGDKLAITDDGTLSADAHSLTNLQIEALLNNMA